MKAEQIDKALHTKFITEGQRLVFWHDADKQFAEYVSAGLAGPLADVQVLDVGTVGGLPIKLKLEREDTVGKYLLYSHGEPLPAEQDWLFDIRLYSAQFHADISSIWLQELGLGSLSLRDHLEARATFLGNQERRKKLKRFIVPQDDQAAIDLKMMAVLAGSELATPFAILQALCHGHVQEGRYRLSEEPKAMVAMGKMALSDGFWALMAGEFDYVSDSPRIAELLRRLFVSELFQQANCAPMPSLAHHQLPASGSRNTVVFLTQWRDSSGRAGSYDAVASAVASEQKVEEVLKTLDLEMLKDVFTFLEAEKRVISLLKQRVLTEQVNLDVDSVKALAVARQAGHWLGGPGGELPERRAIGAAYDAIVAAAELFALRKAHHNALGFETPESLLHAYCDELYAFDRFYRRFCTQAMPALGQGWDLLKTLADEVERVYDNGFLQPLGIEWSRLLDEGFLQQWSSPTIPGQANFYSDTIRPHLSGSDRKRAYVIISDAFRYEAGKGLCETLNGRYRMNAEIAPMLGVLPSYTALGMASLLPHETLAYNDKGDVLVDGKSVAGTKARGKRLAAVEGMACQADDLRRMKINEARTFTEGHRVVYIYHNVIDARGDSASTESETFDAVEDCINELVELVQFCVNKLNATKVWVTADHGFLFQQEAPDATDKSKLSHKPESAVKVKKRYVIGRNLGTSAEAHSGAIQATADGGEMEFWVPRGANKFHFTGGARFVHGGAMPQEVIVPLVEVTRLRGKHKEGSRAEKVRVQVLESKHKITTPKYRFTIIQTDAVSERKKPITLRAAIYDGAQPVTSIETVIFESTSNNMDDRKKDFTLELRTGSYDKATPYRLVLRDAENDAEVQSVPVVIDRNFDDDF